MNRTVRSPLRTLVPFVVLVGALSSAGADTSALIDTLTRQLGVSRSQATGGAGAIFDYAMHNMTATDYATVASALPGVDGLVAAAPKTGGSSSSLGGLVSSLGGSSAAGASNLAGQFAELGMGPDMVNKFIPIVLDYAQSEGGQMVMTILKDAVL